MDDDLAPSLSTKLGRNPAQSNDPLLRCNVIFPCKYINRTTTVLSDGETLCLLSTPAKGTKEQLDQGRLRDRRKMLKVAFDRVLGENAKQEDVYEQVRACVRCPFQGKNLPLLLLVQVVCRSAENACCSRFTTPAVRFMLVR